MPAAGWRPPVTTCRWARGRWHGSSRTRSSGRWPRRSCSASWPSTAGWCTSTCAMASWCSTSRPRPRWRDRSNGAALRPRFLVIHEKARHMAGLFIGLSLARAVGDAALAQVVRRQFDADLVASENADVVLAHLAGDVRGYDVPVFQLHAEHGVGQGVDDSTFHFEAVFFRHAVKPSVTNEWPGAWRDRQKRRALCTK